MEMDVTWARYPLTPENIEMFLERHVRLYDGVIHKIEPHNRNSERPLSDLLVEMEVRDREAETGWCSLQLHFEALSFFRLLEGARMGTNAVTSSNGVKVLFVQDAISFDFSPSSKEEDDLLEFENSSFAVAAQRAWIEARSDAEAES